MYNNTPQATNNFCEEMINSPELNGINQEEIRNPNDTYEILENVIEDAKSKHLSCKSRKYDKYKHKNSKWITRGILISLKFRDTLYKKLKMASNPIGYEPLLFSLYVSCV